MVTLQYHGLVSVEGEPAAGGSRFKILYKAEIAGHITGMATSPDTPEAGAETARANSPVSADGTTERKSFAALRHAGARPYLIYSALVMMADSIEHVISYWIIFEKFHSPALGGFAVVSH